MYNHNRAMCEELGKKVDRIIVSGGGSNGALFMQIFADIFGIPASRNEINGAVSIGSAICAAVGVGLYKNFEEAMGRMIRPRDQFQPIAAHTDLYRKMNDQVYRHITQYTDEVLKKSYPIFG